MPENKFQRVGVLVVHGIGEQHQFEHLEEIVRNVAAALQADRNLTDVQIDVNFGNVAAYLADQQTLRTGNVPTAIIEVKNLKSGQATRLEFKEVWWADLDEPTNFRTALLVQDKSLKELRGKGFMK
jgi:hypothetical protein